MTFNKEAMISVMDEITINYSRNEKNQLADFLELVSLYMTRKIKVKDFETRLMFISTKIKDDGFLIQSKMYNDQPTAKNKMEVELKIIDKMCDKCKGIGNFCNVGRSKENKLYSICGICQMEL